MTVDTATAPMPRIEGPGLPDRGAPGYPSVSVVICAYTDARRGDLRRACESVQRQLQPDDELIVVIDHNDTLLTWAACTLTGVRVLASTGRPGLSGARNTGVATSGRDVVAFLDDDAIARPGWLDALRDVLRDEAVSAVGTQVLPRWVGGRPPRWFPEEFGWVVGCGYLGLPTRRSVIRNPIGASMAVRRSAFGVAGAFSDLVGRVGALPVGCEETEFCIRVSKALPDTIVVHEPDAAVDHTVPFTRQTVRYFLRRCYHEGRSKWAVTQLSGARAGLAAERRYVRSVLPRGVLRGLGQGVRRLDVFALAKAGAIVAGLTATVAGYTCAAGVDKVKGR